MNKVNLDEKFGMFSEHWSPKVVGRVQDCDVKLAKLLGEFEWHHHPEEDEMFFVVKGRLVEKPWYQGIEFFVALRRLHQPVWLLNYNGEAHGLRKYQNRKDFAVRMLQFFDHYLMGVPVPVWMEEGIPAVKKGKDLGLRIVTETATSGGGR